MSFLTNIPLTNKMGKMGGIDIFINDQNNFYIFLIVKNVLHC